MSKAPANRPAAAICYRELAAEPRYAMRGGRGKGAARTYLSPGQMTGIQFVTEMTLAPGADIGLHPHADNEELYVMLRGRGMALWNDERFEVGPADAFLCRRGERHGLVNTGSEPLVFLAVLTTEKPH